MKVSIIEKRTGKVVARYPITLKGVNHTPADEENFAGAWKRAVEDRFGAPDSQRKYTLSFLNPGNHHPPK